MTDERQNEALWRALARLPRGAGVVFRHYRTPPAERRRLYERVRAIARARGLVLVLAGAPRDAIAWRADGAHGRSPHRTGARPLLRTAPAHGARELLAGRRRGAALLFLSPVFATRSHPGARTLGPVRFGKLVEGYAKNVIALGGMSRSRGDRLAALGAYGWAAIDAWDGQSGLPGTLQNLKAVPI
jgi:thiamine-phosphate pyrophosphorylase